MSAELDKAAHSAVGGCSLDHCAPSVRVKLDCNPEGHSPQSRMMDSCRTACPNLKCRHVREDTLTPTLPSCLLGSSFLLPMSVRLMNGFRRFTLLW